MHQLDDQTELLTDAIVRYAVERTRLDPPPLDQPRTSADLDAAVGRTITPEGLGGAAALSLFADELAPACISIDHPRFLAFVPGAPTDASILFDLVVGASSIYAGSWLEGSGAVWAENQALAWIASLAGLPATAGGVFVSGGTAGNLSALVAARHRWRLADPELVRERAIVVCSKGAHSSIGTAARVMDAEVLVVPTGARGRLEGSAVAEVVDSLEPGIRRRVCAVVATAGTTNLGVVDDLAGVAAVARRLGVWFHVDGAYGGAALAAPSRRHLFDGIERADSFIVDPHKWLFAPYDCCALVYRDPTEARRAHTQHAEYLDVLHGDDGADEPWNPSDFAYHLSRRARGLPFWFSLATYGTDAYRNAVERCLRVTEETDALVDSMAHVERVIQSDLSVVVFRRIGWTPSQYQAWSDRALKDQLAFVVPSAYQGETVFRFCFVNPRTTIDDARAILESMA